MGFDCVGDTAAGRGASGKDAGRAGAGPQLRLSGQCPRHGEIAAGALQGREKGAKVGDVYVADSLESGVRLFPDEGGREIDVTFSDEKMTHVEFVMTVDKSTWSGPSGLRLGSPMADVVAANKGRPLKINGFDWDYGGWVSDANGGPLNGLAGKECAFGVKLDTTAALSENDGDKIIGEGVTVTSTDPLVIRAKPVISEMSIMFRPKP